MKAISKIKYVLFLMVIVGFVSCKGEIGPIGPDGTDGTDGVNGTDGVDGEDGNANVTSVLLEGSAIVIGNNDYSVIELTQDIYDNGVVLGYAQLPAASFWETLPLVDPSTNLVMLDIDRIYVGTIRLVSTFANPNVNLRFILIAGFTNKSLNSKQAIYDDLENAGVDINNYYEVMDYYGLDY